MFRALAFTALICLTASAAAFDWEYLAMSGKTSTCIEADDQHGRIFVGTIEGFHYLEQSTGVWTNRDAEGWIGRTVWSIDWHHALDGRVITGRENAFFKGYLEYSDDLGATDTYVYGSQGGGVSGLLHAGFTYFACTWPDISPGEFLRSYDGGETWSLLGGHGHYAMTGLAEGLSGELYLVGDNAITQSWDEGATWTQVGGGLPPMLITCVERAFPGGDVIPPMGVVVGNDAGLFYSSFANDWAQIHMGGVRRVATMAGPVSWPMNPDFVAVVTNDGRLLLERGLGGPWDDETGNLPGTPIDVAYSYHDNSLYVCTQSHGVFRAAEVVTAVQEAPAAAARLRAWPNPFNPATKLSFSIPEAGAVKLTVHDASGRLVATLVDGPLGAGPHGVEWRPETAASGVYLARLTGKFGGDQLRLVLLK